MKKEIYTYPKSSFLSVEKDLGLIVDTVLKNERLKKLLFYTTKDCLEKPNLTQAESVGLFGNEIKLVPKLYVDNSVKNYIIINFNNFSQNATNPEFRNNLIEFDIVCHFDQWHLKDFQLRPYKIAAEIDSILNNKHLTGIGTLQFVGSERLILNDEFAGLCLLYSTIHGEEGKINMPGPKTAEQDFIKNFDAMFNQHRV